MSYMTGDDILKQFNEQTMAAQREHQRHVDEFLYQLWHDAKVEQPKFEAWILMADAHGHYMAGEWQNDGKGFEGIGEMHIGPFKFDLPIGLEGDIVKWCYIRDIDKALKGGYCD